MRADETRKLYLEIGGFALAAVVLHQLNLFVLLFLIPLQVLYLRRGWHAFVYGQVFTLAATAGIRLVRHMTGGAGVHSGLFALDLLIPAVFLAGLAVVNAPRFQHERTVARLLLAAGVTGIAAAPILVLLVRATGIEAVFQAQVEQLVEVLRAASADNESYQSAVLRTFLDADRLYAMSRDIFLSSFVAGYFVFLTANWWLGTYVSARYTRLRADAPKLASFRVPDYTVWLLIGGLAGILLDLSVGLGAVGYAFWNVLYTVAFLYGLQGLGIIGFTLSRYRAPRSLRVALGFGAVFVAFWPGVNLALFIGVPALGVAEHWLKLRKAERSDEEQ
jgi:hypothetical protein